MKFVVPICDSLPDKYITKYSSQNIRVTKSRSTHGTDDKCLISFYSESTKRSPVAYSGKVVQEQRHACVAQHSTSVGL